MTHNNAENLTARELAKELGTTVAPIFVHFSSMDELRQEVRALARNRLREYIRQGMQARIPFLEVGLRYVRFAKEESELYRFLFLSDNVADAHSIATLIVAGGGSFTEEEVGAIYVELGFSLRKAYKETRGLWKELLIKMQCSTDPIRYRLPSLPHRQ